MKNVLFFVFANALETKQASRSANAEHRRQQIIAGQTWKMNKLKIVTF